MNPLADYRLTTFEHSGRTHRVYRKGDGPAVIVLHEMPGLHPRVIEFADRVVARGYRVYMPVLFGRAGRPIGTGVTGAVRMACSLVEICLFQQFRIVTDRTSPAVHWLREFAVQARAECNDQGVGVVGMCITGGFALAMAVNDAVLAPVLSQPSLPALLPGSKCGLGIDAEDLKAVQKRGLPVLGLRFTGDRLCPRERFLMLKDALGDQFEEREITSPDARWQIRERAHAVLTVDFVDQPGHPTQLALERVLAFLDERLRGQPLPPGP